VALSPSQSTPAAASNTILAPRPSTVLAPIARYYFIPAASWFYIMMAASLIALAAANGYRTDSLWVGVGVWVAVAVALHTAMAAPSVPWIPGLIALIALLQWVLGAWAGYHVPPLLSTMAMAVPSEDYFSYMVPATVLFVVGLYLPLWRMGRRLPPRSTPALPVDFVRSCDIMVVVGLAASFVQGRGVPLALQYALLLVGYLCFVGAFALLLAKAEGWGWRLAAVIGLRVILSSSDGMFHDLLLWLAYTFVLLGFVFRWRARTITLVAVAGVVVMGALNQLKMSYRAKLDEDQSIGLDRRVAALGSAFARQIEEPTSAFTGESLSRTVTRVNQGWIISRILYWVPAREPYARGETIANAVRATLVPRVLDPDKYVAGGYYFTRFTGIPLFGSSMNLSSAGEMYANFGRTGGLVGIFLFAIGLGLLYRVFARWAFDSPLWWAWAPYVMLYTMQAETGIGEAVNHVARSFLVMMLVVSTVPGWKDLRRWRPLLRRIKPVGGDGTTPTRATVIPTG
jgi:hypothetical protein